MTTIGVVMRQRVKGPGGTTQLTLGISVIKTNHGMLHRTNFTVCSETNTKHVM